ncbi:hypothetical protein SLEP1_g7388 [Rubroshorea leprosula]|uniref:Uncharacterized protein n=1 Tax=Rubroshorea leprosula TaxID=152421 RepID=A0AAV5I404_9ROSI|nr:hypothetical protein SLEP1_g7388 [Rubroshorea leprosula]
MSDDINNLLTCYTAEKFIVNGLLTSFNATWVDLSPLSNFRGGFGNSTITIALQGKNCKYGS